MKFEVIGPDGNHRIAMHEESCLPTKDEIQSMANAGFKFKLDGKVIAKSKALEMAKSNSIKKVSKKTAKSTDTAVDGHLF